ncbi:hypothetical protein BRDID11004_48040 [Bradyrhizobium diazoefficiens]|uniref:Helix-turn-helix domain-containing protein n=1 Tax=Bradyrhizobium diazoefficiens TaxID=1355477 RepID=A0A810A4P2_9BRAD|nr:hypothetical protein F07S3_41260 [Bradyrhizobium diazoefficiens]BCE56381.1 hypothetical protein XF5B_38930 [Bradyrhizobium diazoefficiens]
MVCLTQDDSELVRLHNVRGVVRALGGTEAVAAFTKRSPQAVSNWIAEDRISPRLFLLMSAALKEHGYSADPSLWGQEAAVI